jgi:2',3'-cyclic-nucleotide 2'-phosphodiesterase (5'-nucleotidase family)
VEGKPLGLVTGPLEKIRPWLIKEIAGIRLAVLSATTPALTSWLPPENLIGFEVLDPVEALRGLLRQVADLKPDAILLAGHMGLTRLDDIANRVGALTREFPQLAVYLGGHTHQNHPSVVVNNVLYTQADHFGIYAGKVDLTFDRASRRLVHRSAVTRQMDRDVAFDPLVLSLARAEIDFADHLLAQPIGMLAEPFGIESSFGQPSDVERLIASAMISALRQKGVEVDAIVHGLFDDRSALAPGPKTIADAWTVLPYENQIVTVDLNGPDLLALAQELGAASEPRSLMGVGFRGQAQGGAYRVDAVLAADGSPLPPRPAYRVALNSYDSQSAGERFPTIGRLVAQPANHRVLHPLRTRDALIDFFVSRRKVSRASLLV